MQNKEKKNKTRFDAKEAKKQRFKKYNFKYLPKEDAYLCPAGIKLTRKDNEIRKKAHLKYINPKNVKNADIL